MAHGGEERSPVELWTGLAQAGERAWNALYWNKSVSERLSNSP